MTPLPAREFGRLLVSVFSVHTFVGRTGRPPAGPHSLLTAAITNLANPRRALEEATASLSKGKVAIRASGKAIEKAEAAVVAAEEEAVATAAALEKAKAEYSGIEEAALRVM